MLFPLLLLLALQPDACPIRIAIDAQGHLSENRMHGMYRVSKPTLIQDLQGGCKEGGPISSITIQSTPQTNYAYVKDIIDLIHQYAPNVLLTILDPITTPTPEPGNFASSDHAAGPRKNSETRRKSNQGDIQTQNPVPAPVSLPSGND